jgi:hypothetical protein
MSNPARDEVRLLDEWNDTALLTLLMNLLILPTEINTRKTTRGKIGIKENNMLGVSRPKGQLSRS